MRVRAAVRWALVVFLCALGVTVVMASMQGSPVLGDRSQTVSYHNSTATMVDLYVGGRQYTGTRQRLDAGETIASSWPQSMVPTRDGRVRVVADDANGVPVFCRDISFEELEQNGWRIDVVVASQPGC